MTSKCTETLIEQVRPLVERNTAWTLIAKAVGVARRTLFEWKDPDSAYYNADFARMVAEAKEEFDSGRTKAGQMVQSVKHTLRKVIKERKVTKCPTMPPTSFTKAMHIDYADKMLDLELDPKFTIREMRYEMSIRIDELIEYGEPYYVVEDVIVRIEETEVDPSQAAVKNVLTNTGKEEDQWKFQMDMKHEIEPKTIADIAAAMGIGSDSGN